MNVAKALSREKEQSLGRVISDLARRGLHAVASPPAATRNGIPLLPRRNAPPVTSEMVRALLDAED